MINILRLGTILKIIFVISIIPIILSAEETFAADEPPGSPTIQIIVDTTGGDDSFDFLIFNATNPADKQVVTIDTAIKNFSPAIPVQAGSYSVEEIVPSLNWRIITSDCVIDGESHGIVLNFNIFNGQTVVCTFVNLFVSPDDVDILLIKSANLFNPNTGDTVVYNILVRNLGPGGATGILVEDILPPGLTFVGDSPSQGIYDSGTGIWNVGDMFAGQAESLTITVTVDSGAGGTIIVNIASITAVDQTDSNTLNDFDDAIITIATGIFDDVAKTFLNTPIAIDVLANDSDPDGDVLSFVSSQFPITTLEGGKVTDNLDGTLTYSPLLGYVTPTDSRGTGDSFSYDITDGTNISSADVLIKVFDVPTYYAMEDASDDLIIFDPNEDGGDAAINFDFSGVDVTLPGRFVFGAYGLATNPLTDELYGLLRTSPLDFSSDNLELVKIDPLTGNGVSVGIVSLDEDFAEIAFDNSAILFGITGKFSSNSNELHTISLIDASTNFVCSLIDNDDETVIGFNSNDGLIYHISGVPGSSGDVESVDVTLPNTCVITVIDVSGEITGNNPLGFTFDVANDKFLMSDENGELYELKITSSTTAFLDTSTGGGSLAPILSVDALSIVSNDFDGIYDPIDNDPGTFSNDFGDGTTSGTIVNRGDQLISVIPVPSGIRISADPSGGATLAEIDDCENSSNQFLTAGDSMIINCGSITIKVISGPIEVNYNSDTGLVGTSTLETGDNVTFDSQTLSFTNNGQTQVLVDVNGQLIPVDSEQTIVFDVEDPPKVEICHKNKKTLSINPDSVDDHLGHGDTEGACETEDKPKKDKEDKPDKKDKPKKVKKSKK